MYDTRTAKEIYEPEEEEEEEPAEEGEETKDPSHPESKWWKQRVREGQRKPAEEDGEEQ